MSRATNDFGERVKIDRVVVRVKRSGADRGSLFHVSARDRMRYHTPVHTWGGGPAAWPGDPFPGSDYPSEKGAVVRLRTFPIEPTEGVIVGEVRKAEGTIKNFYGGMDEGYVGYLSDQRRTLLYEVALVPKRKGQAARVVLVAAELESENE